VAAIDSHFIQSMEASMFYPQGNFYSQGTLGYPQGGFGYPQGGFGSPQGGFGQQSPPQLSNWQHLAQQQAALQLQALLQLLAPQLAGINATANGIGQPVGGWQQPQANPEQINPALLQQPQQQLQQPQQQLQRLAQYHHLVAQQFAHLAAQQAAQNSGNPYAAQLIPGNGQFVANQLGTNFVPGITMH
jgi:hypothetical protein